MDSHRWHRRRGRPPATRGSVATALSTGRDRSAFGCVAPLLAGSPSGPGFPRRRGFLRQSHWKSRAICPAQAPRLRRPTQNRRWPGGGLRPARSSIGAWQPRPRVMRAKKSIWGSAGSDNSTRRRRWPRQSWAGLESIMSRTASVVLDMILNTSSRPVSSRSLMMCGSVTTSRRSPPAAGLVPDRSRPGLPARSSR